MSKHRGAEYLEFRGATKARGLKPALNPSRRQWFAPAVGGGHFPPWQLERAAWLHRICQRILSRAHRGQSERRIFRHFARIWDHKPFRANRTKRWQLSPDTLRRHYLQWAKDQRPEAFLPRHRPGRTPVPRALVREFLHRCGLPGALTILDAYRSLTRDLAHHHFIRDFGTLADWLEKHPRLKKPGFGRQRLPFTARSFYRALTCAQHAAVKRLHRANRVQLAAQSAFAHTLASKTPKAQPRRSQ